MWSLILVGFVGAMNGLSDMEGIKLHVFLRCTSLGCRFMFFRTILSFIKITCMRKTHGRMRYVALADFFHPHMLSNIHRGGLIARYMPSSERRHVYGELAILSLESRLSDGVGDQVFEEFS